MSRLWTGFFGTERCRTPKIFQNPDFSLKRRDFWVFLQMEQGRDLPVRKTGGIDCEPAGFHKLYRATNKPSQGEFLKFTSEGL